MAGHSHFRNIRFRKERQDAARGKLRSKLLREIEVAAREGGGNPAFNTRLRLALEAAREANVPKEAAERAIRKGTGELAGTSLEEATIEGYGPAGVAFLVRVQTDNRRRTIAEIRQHFSQVGGKLGEAGSVTYLFEEKGVIRLPLEGQPLPSEALALAAIDLGAEDVSIEDGFVVVKVPPKRLAELSLGLKDRGIRIGEAILSMEPRTIQPVREEGQARLVLHLMASLDDHPDVSRVFANFDIPEELFGKIEGV